MKQDIERQYDDDLTLGTDEYDDSYYTDADDLFELSTDDESPISRLKSLVLSIDWEITDEVLLQFNEELMDLKGIWAGNSINLVYVQALEKISKYIYQNKADSHPNSIKLLLTLYYNLEKIVSSEDLSESQKKEILLEDVKKFEALKRQISQMAQPADKPSPPARPEPAEVKKEAASEDKLLNLKAIVLGIDWEITDHDLNGLRQEVVRLEEQFADSRPKLILLQGIGTLGAYIKMKKSNAHADAFKVLHLFYESLEKIVQTPMSLQDEKAILFPAVEKFNAFKTLLGSTISPDAIGRKEEDEDDEDDEEYSESGSGEIAPAFADIPEEEAIGFQADEEAKTLGIEGSDKVASHIDDFFGETFGVPAEEAQPLAPAETDETLEEEEILAVLGFEDEGTAVLPAVERDIALQGVDVEADDEEVVEPIATAFAAGEDDAVAAIRGGVPEEDAAESFLSTLEDELPAGMPSSDEEVARVTESIFAEDEDPSMKAAYGEVDRSSALQGVDVETEADEDSDEVSLPMEGEEFAPALMASDEESIFSAKTLEHTVASGGIGDELGGTLDELFLEEEQQSAYRSKEPAAEEDFGGEIGREEDLGDEIAEVASLPDESSEELSIFEAIGVTDEAQAEISETERVTESTDTEAERADDLLSLEEQEEELDLFAEEGDSERSVEESVEVDTFFESLETATEEEIEDLAEPEAELDLAEPEVELDLAEPEVELELAGPEFEERIEALFAVEEVAVDQAGEEKIAATPVEEAESAGFEDVALSYPAEDEAGEGEVVFELAEESVEAPSIPFEPAFEAVAAEEPEIEWAEEAAETSVPVFAGEEREDSDLAFAATELPGDMAAVDPLGGLRGCIESLGIELDDKVINGLFQEINGLRQKWSDRPLEKTFLQLLSTITQHIDQYRFESSSEAFNLLQSVGNALADSRDKEPHSSQELLLAETLKVLEWQQGMLARQAVQKGEQLTFAAPVRTEGEEVQGVSDAQEDFDQQLQHYGETVDDVTLPADERNWQEELAVFPIEESEPDIVAAGETLFTRNAELSREDFAEELKQEIASLRQTLQKEIAELRNELKGM